MKIANLIKKLPNFTFDYFQLKAHLSSPPHVDVASYGDPKEVGNRLTGLQRSFFESLIFARSEVFADEYFLDVLLVFCALCGVFAVFAAFLSPLKAACWR